MADFKIRNEGSMIGLKPVSDEANDWFDENVDTDQAYYLGGFLFGDHRPMGHIIEALDAAGFTTELA